MLRGKGICWSIGGRAWRPLNQLIISITTDQEVALLRYNGVTWPHGQSAGTANLVVPWTCCGWYNKSYVRRIALCYNQLTATLCGLYTSNERDGHTLCVDHVPYFVMEKCRPIKIPTSRWRNFLRICKKTLLWHDTFYLEVASRFVSFFVNGITHPEFNPYRIISAQGRTCQKSCLAITRCPKSSRDSKGVGKSCIDRPWNRLSFWKHLGGFPYEIRRNYGSGVVGPDLEPLAPKDPPVQSLRMLTTTSKGDHMQLQETILPSL